MVMGKGYLDAKVQPKTIGPAEKLAFSPASAWGSGPLFEPARLAGGQAERSAQRFALRRPAKTNPANPSNIAAHVGGSGTTK